MKIEQLLKPWQIKGILFDFDGTLVDTLDMYVNTYVQLLNEFNFSIRRKDIISLFGLKAVDIIKNATKNKVNDAMLEEMINRRHEILETKFNEAKIIPGAIDLLNGLRKNYKLGLVSSGMRYAIIKIAEPMNLLQYFDVVVTADDVPYTKPNPFPFLFASRKLLLPSKVCLVIGDSIYDIIGAKKAGMKAILVLNNNREKSKELKDYQPDFTVNSLEELL